MRKYILCMCFCMLLFSACGKEVNILDDLKAQDQKENKNILLTEELNHETKNPELEIKEDNVVTDTAKIKKNDTDSDKEEPKEGPKEESKILEALPELTGEFKKFETKDLQGNTVNQTVISDAKLTVLNIWGTFCSPCIEEIPYLAEISDEYKDKGVQIIGLVSDAYSDSQITKAKVILERSKANYLNIVSSNELNEIYLKNVLYIPETVFIDNTGKVLDSSVGAMNKDAWKNKIDEMLKKVAE